MAAVAISLAALLALAGLFQILASRRDARAFPPPGRMVPIGGRRLHARVAGSGAPAVVLEAGISATSINWAGIQPQVAEFTTCVSYDRAGLAWSDAAQGTYDVDRMVADLAALLEGLVLQPPHVLVGHSFGALLVRLFEERFPDKVAGMVLIDPVSGCVWAHPDGAHARVKRRGEQVARWGAWCARFGLMRLATSPAVVKTFVVPRFGGTSVGRTGVESETGVVDRLQTELMKLPQEVIPMIRAHWCRPKNFRAMVAHLAALEPAFAAVKNLPIACPVTVISAGNTPAEGIAEHRAIAALSPQGQHVVAEHSGHWVQFDQPELVIGAIRRVAGLGTA